MRHASQREEGLPAVVARRLGPLGELLGGGNLRRAHQQAAAKAQRARLAHRPHVVVCGREAGQGGECMRVEMLRRVAHAPALRGLHSTKSSGDHCRPMAGAPPAMLSMSATWAMPTRRRTMTAPAKPRASRHSSFMNACCASPRADAPCVGATPGGGRGGGQRAGLCRAAAPAGGNHQGDSKGSVSAQL